MSNYIIKACNYMMKKCYEILYCLVKLHFKLKKRRRIAPPLSIHNNFHLFLTKAKACVAKQITHPKIIRVENEHLNVLAIKLGFWEVEAIWLVLP